MPSVESANFDRWISFFISTFSNRLPGSELDSTDRSCLLWWLNFPDMYFGTLPLASNTSERSSSTPGRGIPSVRSFSFSDSFSSSAWRIMSSCVDCTASASPAPISFWCKEFSVSTNSLFIAHILDGGGYIVFVKKSEGISSRTRPVTLPRFFDFLWCLWCFLLVVFNVLLCARSPCISETFA